MRSEQRGASDLPSETAGDATKESVGTDLRRADDAAEVDPQQSDTEEGAAMSPEDLDLPGPTFRIDEA